MRGGRAAAWGTGPRADCPFVGMETDLAMLGGRPAAPRNTGSLEWPVVTQADKGAVLRVLDSLKFAGSLRLLQARSILATRPRP